MEIRVAVFTPIPKKGSAKKCSNYCTIELIPHASKVMLKILQVRLPGMKSQVGLRKHHYEQS